MTRRRSSVIVVTGLAVIVVATAVGYHFAPLPNAGFADSAAALAIVTAAAVAIERSVEFMWTTITSVLGEWWPMSVVRQQIDDLTNGLDPIVESFYRDANNAVELLAARGKLTASALETARQELSVQRVKVDAGLVQLRKLAPDSQRAQLMAATVAQGIAVFDANFSAISSDAQRAVNVANQATQGVGDFLATFKDNPGKRLISIWVGALAGISVATVLGLDLFQAVFSPAAGAAATPTTAPTPDPAGIVVTGIVIGLGASPTHEIIQVLQEFKKARRTQNQAVIE